MMVIRQNASGVTGSPQGTFYPADRCTWVQTYDNATRNYDINTGFFYPGHAGPVTLGSDITLGFIGKSGRFVGITET